MGFFGQTKGNRMRLLMYTTGVLLLCTHALGQGVQPELIQGTQLPITAPIHNLEGTLDPATGRFTRHRTVTIGDDGKQEVYDNTCGSGFYMGLLPAGPGGTGSARAQLFGDFGAIPSFHFNGGAGLGDAFCTVGCDDDYDITQFEIAWCQVAAPVSGSVIELNFWNTPHQSCLLGTAPGNNPTGGVYPPATSTTLSATLTGLPRNNQIGSLACYVLNITFATPGFNLDGSNSFAPGSTAGDKFAWSFTIPTTTGSDGPIVAGDINLGTSCEPCDGTIWVGGRSDHEPGDRGGPGQHDLQRDLRRSSRVERLLRVRRGQPAVGASSRAVRRQALRLVLR
jgi:hypothetical protein